MIGSTCGRTEMHESSRVAAEVNIIHPSLEGWMLDDQTFRKMLCLERKRTERSGRRFILMVLHLDSLRRQDEYHRFEKFLSILSSATRETDIKGWYKRNCAFGIIFTEIGDGDANTIIKTLSTRVTEILYDTLQLEDINQIRLSFHTYPGEDRNSGGERSPDLTLYPEQVSEPGARRMSRLAKRAIDISGSLSALLVLSPLLILIAIGIRLTSRGPILFRQKRVGRHGAVFTFFKFRSMYVSSDEGVHREYVTRFIAGDPASDAPSSQPKVFKIKNDPRVTRIGKLLRRSSFDELPQLVNVLRGEMSLVGPRPPLPYEVACYEIWHKRRLLGVKPGITGLWQVGGRSRVNFNEMVRLDLQYAANWSLWLDLKILVKTPGAVLSGEGAY
jgi:lipopolysaccharide/colanic/teichoic acid biosynthesis glycosyltransferase